MPEKFQVHPDQNILVTQVRLDNIGEDETAVAAWISEGNPNTDELAYPVAAEATDSRLNVNEIYGVLAKHQVTAEWPHREAAAELHRWAVIFNREFGLAVSEISLCIDWLSRTEFGHFRPGHNGFGLKGEIAINERYLRHREPWQVLGTVLHELFHAWQQEHGKPGKPPYHNIEFRSKALQLGLVIDRRGATQYLAESPFKTLLTKYGVHMPAQPPVLRRPRGNSNLKKWACKCPVNVRVAVAEFQARCLICESAFVRA